ncbi:MAG TPA: hypothetical protein VMY99_01970 [Nevskiaceae bacterium]|nr:hypothetical protein [Nevskiaceae bacterium]
MYRGIRQFALGVVASVLVLGFVAPAVVNAQTPGDFSLQVTPSPMVSTITPGQTTSLELKIHNAGQQAETLKIEPRRFSFNNKTEAVELDDTAPPEIAGWIRFSAPTFTVQPGQWFSEQVNLAVPKSAGFSYAFALVVSRKDAPSPATQGGRVLKGSLAVFTLLNVDRPDATRKIDAVKFISTKRMYEYLPAELKVQFKNSGNTIVQPAGNIFVQRGEHDQNPISTLKVNETNGYILPGSTRTLATHWDNGFPVYKTVVNADGTTKQQLTWNWGDLSKLRIGRYTAKLVAIYNDGQRDIPIEGQVSFWVVPWKILIGLLLVLLLVLAGLWSLLRKTTRLFRGKRGSPPSRRSRL